jgi:integrase
MVFGQRIGDVSLENITARDILTFLDGSNASPGTWMVKYRLLRAFFDFWLARGAISTLPMPVKRKANQHPFIPYIYTQSEIRSLLKAVGGCQKDVRCAVDPHTVRAILIFIYATGALLGEVLRLLVEDIDLKKGVITIRRDRYDRSRIIPIVPDLIKVLKGYSSSTPRHHTTDRHFFISKEGKAVNEGTLVNTFKKLRLRSGIYRSNGSRYQPRMYDLRHTFAVHRITAWIKHGADLNRMLRALSIYMGLTGLRTTEKYLFHTPERFRAQLIQLSPQRRKKRWSDDPDLMTFLSQLSENAERAL